MLSMHEESIYALRALRAGAIGYVMKGEELDDIRVALHKVARGEIYISPRLSEQVLSQVVSGDDISCPLEKLSPRDLETLKLFGYGLRTREVAFQLKVGVKTVETHCVRIRQKLGFKATKEMVRFAIDWFEQENDQADVTATNRRNPC